MNTNLQPVKKAVITAFILAVVLLYPIFLLFTALYHDTAVPAKNRDYSNMDKSKLNITISAADPRIRILAADTENTLIVRIQVRNSDGAPVSDAKVQLEADIGSITNSAGSSSSSGEDGKPSAGNSGSSVQSNSLSSGNSSSPEKNNNQAAENSSSPVENNGTSVGSISSSMEDSGSSIENSLNETDPAAALKSEPAGAFRPSAVAATDANGTYTAEYEPPSSINGTNNIILKAKLSGTDKIASIQIKLVPVPVVLVHGYQASPQIFSGVSAYLKSQGFDPLGFSYASDKGVISSAAQLSDYLDKVKTDMASDGIQVKRFDLISHSMGGLVARYYTCSSGYSAKGNVRKLIFVSVPQRGSPFASIGLKYYDDQGMRDLLTDSTLYSEIFPSLSNGGLNPSIQTGSIMGRYDEVVGSESASLAEWNIQTELFDVGDSNFTIDKLLSGEILQAANHKLILYNKKVYQRLVQMLITNIPYPSVK